MNDDFRIRFAFKHMALRGQFVTQLAVIFNNTVMHDGDILCRMRVRIGFIRHAVSRPTRMPDTDCPRQRIFRDFSLQINNFTLCPAPFDPAVNQRCDTGGIISAIFQPFQPVNQKRCHLSVGNNTDNTAHNVFNPLF